MGAYIHVYNGTVATVTGMQESIFEDWNNLLTASLFWRKAHIPNEVEHSFPWVCTMIVCLYLTYQKTMLTLNKYIDELYKQEAVASRHNTYARLANGFEQIRQRCWHETTRCSMKSKEGDE